jgi:ribose transport system substrate-binding protein
LRINPKRRGIAALALIALLGAACGSSSKTAKPNTDSSSTSAPAKAPLQIDKYLNPPADVGVTVPLSAKPPSGKTVAWVGLGTGTTPLTGDGVKAAAEALGWKFINITSDPSPDKQVAAFEQAVQQRPDVIFHVGGDPDTMGAAYDAAKSAGIPVIEANSPAKATGKNGNGILSIVNDADGLGLGGTLAAEWIAKDAAGAPVDVAYVTFPAFTAFTPQYEKFSSRLAELCAGCHVKKLEAQVADIATKVPGQVVSALQEDTSIKYVVYAFGAASIGVNQAITAAGLKVTEVGYNPGPDNLNALKQGASGMWLAQDATILGWLLVDQYARSLLGDKLTGTGSGVPMQAFTKANIPASLDPAKPSLVPNYQQAFRALWHLG